MSATTAQVAEPGAATAHGAASQRAYRIDAIDLLRGLVIVLMAIDHCRDFFLVAGTQDPMTDPHVGPAIFFTRWITHFCAPVFVLLAGTSAGLMGARKSPAELGRFLLLRGLWLILVECVLISNGWTFAPLGVAQDGGRYWVVLQVIWALGASMVVLAGAQFLGRRACLVLGAAIVLGHNLLDPVWPQQAAGAAAPLWVALHARLNLVADPLRVIFAYPLLPWIGVMLLGFGAAGLFEQPAPQRDRALRRVGWALLLGFVLLRAGTAYGDPHPWTGPGDDALRSLMSFLNTNKYPPSLDYLLMTLGPAALFCSVAERLPGALHGALVTLGRVPFAFYVAHIYLIHLCALLLGVAQGYPPGPFVAFFGFFPKGYGVGLPGVYLGWVLVVALLYPFCRWVAQVKARRRDWWLSYL
jgi:uncharacterized membrane protein